MPREVPLGQRHLGGPRVAKGIDGTIVEPTKGGLLVRNVGRRVAFGQGHPGQLQVTIAFCEPALPLSRVLFA